MTKIGLLSDTHGIIDEKALDFFKDCDEIWHAGDIGSLEVLEKLSSQKKVRAVYGNIDGNEIRTETSEVLRFQIEELDIMMTHIGGYPGKYEHKIKQEMDNNPPKVFISGHSHILKVLYDHDYECLHINPGSYGKFGSHEVRTAIRFDIVTDDIKNFEILEIPRG